MKDLLLANLAQELCCRSREQWSPVDPHVGTEVKNEVVRVGPVASPRMMGTVAKGVGEGRLEEGGLGRLCP